MIPYHSGFSYFLYYILLHPILPELARVYLVSYARYIGGGGGGGEETWFFSLEGVSSRKVSYIAGIFKLNLIYPSIQALLLFPARYALEIRDLFICIQHQKNKKKGKKQKTNIHTAVRCESAEMKSPWVLKEMCWCCPACDCGETRSRDILRLRFGGMKMLLEWWAGWCVCDVRGVWVGLGGWWGWVMEYHSVCIR